MSEPKKTFKIGIAMAGAVSAGAYTAGVIDYLLETLSKWEKAKEINKQLGADHPDYDRSIPMHDVSIEVIGGSSAGGMTSAITALSLFEGIRPINEANVKKEKNRLYDAWVNLNDQGDDPMSTLKQMFKSDDIFDENGVVSILNSRPINAIAERAVKLKEIKELPDYISPNLEVILTITSLRGIPLAVNFFDEEKKAKSLGPPPKPVHKMYLHKGIAHFKINTKTNLVPPHTILLNPHNKEDREELLNCAVATGAFPVGLAPRHLKNTRTKYIRAMVERMFKPKSSEAQTYNEIDPERAIRIDIKDDVFDFFAVDGGTVNNEPFGEVIKVLEEKCQHDEGNNYAVLMIDPFPNFEAEESGRRNTAPKLLQLIPKIFGAIRGQAMMKESDLVNGLSSSHTLRMIFPSRRIGDKKDPYPISCGALDGFGGFFSREFREHDFQLGRKNCQSFLRNYFCIPLSKAGKGTVFEDWDADDERHERYYSESVDGYPIIPDIDYDHRRAQNEEIATPVRERLDVKEVLGLEGLIKKRLKEVLLNIDKYDEMPDTADERKLERTVERILQDHYKVSTWQRFKTDLLSAIAKLAWKYFGANKAADIATRSVLKTIIMDFQKRGLLYERDEDR
jgi:hypothetical protein